MAMANPRDEAGIDQSESLVGMFLFKSLLDAPIDLKTFISLMLGHDCFEGLRLQRSKRLWTRRLGRLVSASSFTA